MQTLLAGTAGLSLLPPPVRAASKEAFAFPLFGDLHYDKLSCHDLELLGREKPDDLRQVREYSALSTGTVPRLFASVRETIADLNGSPDTTVPFAVQVGDLVEGLCGSAEQAWQLDADALTFVRESRLGVPFLFTKGNHDITGPGAADAFKSVFHPFLGEQAAVFGGDSRLTAARYRIEYGNALFCFFDAYDKESLPWLEAELARRTARHCFVILHPPVVPYGARSTWHLYSGERDKAQRERLLDLLGKHNVFVLSGHIHKYNLLVRTAPGGGKFLQLGVSSVINAPEPQPRHLLSGVKDYNGDQVTVEPNFSPASEQQRRAVYQVEAPLVTQFQYADLPGYAVVQVNGPRVTAIVYSGVGRQAWRTLALSELLAS
ncbi:MAG: metallophosphoesterase [Verrucomicrobia bacterium]|jgi:hypothetical protein|nr:metallophosphoesterase [Verrucomicrobiota bacterium]